MGQFCPRDGTRLIHGASETAPPPDSSGDPLIGQVVGDRFRIVARLGSGGMGTVYEAEHRYIKKRVALKLLHPETTSHPDALRRFEREALAASTIGHENIVAIDDFGRLPDGQVYLTMEFLDGLPLSDILQHGAIPLDQMLEVAIQTCHGLGAAHAQGIIHRDMKPENIFLVNKLSRVKILDFGIAKVVRGEAKTNLTKTGAIFGTPNYMAPEQALGRRVDHRADVYSVGVILYEMLTGRLPFCADSFVAILTMHVTEPPKPPRQAAPERDIPEALEAVVLRAMAKDPDDRFTDMRAMVAALLEIRRVVVGDVPLPSQLNLSRIQAPIAPTSTDEHEVRVGRVTAMDGELVPLPWPHRRRRGLIVGLTAAALVLSAGGTAAFLLLRKPQEQGRAAAPGTAAPGSSVAVHPPASNSAQRPRDPATPPKVTVLIGSKPDEATVERGGREIGQTPLPLRATAGEKIVVTLKRRGFEPMTVDLVATDGLKHIVPLKQSGQVAPRSKARKIVAGAKTKPVKQPKKGAGHDHDSDHGSDHSQEPIDPYQ
jgi:eukaryotic-like serine/threonine-protein kinase